MILIFVLGYLCIALEHKLRIDKAAIALLMCGALWTVLSLLGNDAQIGTQLIEQLGDTSEILFFLIGAMTIVELIDRHGGFHVITDHIKTRNKRKLLWLLSIITFFMSAVLDNMTTTIIMIMLLRRMISGQKERWIFASVIVIAANSGGAFSPIGDVTTIMLWMRGNVTSGLLVAKLFLPALVSVIIPTAIACRYIPEDFYKPKLVWAELSRTGNSFAIDTSKILLGNTGYILTVPSNNIKELGYIMAFMNSRIVLYQLDRLTTRFDDNGWRWLRQFVEEIKIPKFSDNPQISGIALEASKSNQEDISEQLNNIISSILGLNEQELSYINDSLKGY